MRQGELFDSDTWIADGNHGGTLDVRLSRADTVIIFAFSRMTCVLGALQRTTKNRGTAIQAPGCPERFDLKLLMWIWRYPTESRPRLDAAIGEHDTYLQVIEMRSRGAARRFLNDLPGAPD